MAITALILGIVALVICWIPCFSTWAVLLAIPAIVLGAIAMSKAKKEGKPRGMAIAGLVIGIIATIVSLLWWLLFAGAAAAASAGI